MRYGLRDLKIPRVFQVPGPLHLEHSLPRCWELATAREEDFWIASSEYIRRLYVHSGVPQSRVFLSYYGTRVSDFAQPRRGNTRARFGVADDAFMVGNINYMYRPKRYLGQTRGVKGHEDVIEAIGLASKRLPQMTGFIGGGGWGRDARYERALRRRASRVAPGKVLMPGFLCCDDVAALWPEFDLVVHAPRSENCGGIHEAMIAGAAVVATAVGGLPELVIRGVTGWLVPSGSITALADAILAARESHEATRRMAATGMERARVLFDVQRTGREVRHIYDVLASTHAGDPT